MPAPLLAAALLHPQGPLGLVGGTVHAGDGCGPRAAADLLVLAEDPAASTRAPSAPTGVRRAGVLHERARPLPR